MMRGVARPAWLSVPLVLTLLSGDLEVREE
jgi:hypothetical protein